MRALAAAKSGEMYLVKRDEETGLGVYACVNDDTAKGLFERRAEDNRRRLNTDAYASPSPLSRTGFSLLISGSWHTYTRARKCCNGNTHGGASVASRGRHFWQRDVVTGSFQTFWEHGPRRRLVWINWVKCNGSEWHMRVLWWRSTGRASQRVGVASFGFGEAHVGGTRYYKRPGAYTASSCVQSV